jgi:hypothetical protein
MALQRCTGTAGSYVRKPTLIPIRSRSSAHRRESRIALHQQPPPPMQASLTMVHLFDASCSQ